MKLWRKAKILLNFTISLALLTNIPQATQAQRIDKTRPSAALVRAIREGIPSEIINKTRYYFTETSLNEDSKKEAIVYIMGSLCGNRNCNIVVYQYQDKSYRIILSGLATRPDLAVLPSKSKGWQDIATRGWDLNTETERWNVWKFDGKEYQITSQHLKSIPSRNILKPKPNSEILLSEPGV
jgi:hypothetical protein